MHSEEPLLPLAQAAARFPGHRGAARLHPATLTRWILSGVKALDGRRVKLEAVRLGSCWLTSEGALQRFADALGTTGSPAQPRSPATRSKATAAAARELEKRGA